MAKNHSLLVPLIISLSTMSTALADLANVSISGSVTGTVSFLFAPSDGCAPQPPPSPNFNATNSQTGFGTYSLAMSAACFKNSSVGARVSATQTAIATTQDLTVVTDVETFAEGFNSASQLVLPNTTGSSMLTIAFDLTEPSILDLTSSLTTTCSGFFVSGSCPIINGPGATSANATGAVALTGPSFNISGATNGSFTLNPGHYMLTASNAGSSSTLVLAGSSSVLALDAQFAPIPEPRWLPLLAILILLCLRILQHQRTRRSMPGNQ